MFKQLDRDFLKLDELISTDDRRIRDTVRSFVEKEVVPDVGKHFRSGTFPLELVKRMGELGLMGATLSEYGGAGVSNLAYGLIMQELERGDSGLRSVCSVQGSLVIYPIYTFGSDEQKARWLPGLIDGSLIGCFGLTEPDHGSNPRGMVTRAVKDGSDYILNGAKMWITNGEVADVAVVFAQIDEGEGDEISGFLVERDRKGFSSSTVGHKLSLRASITSQLAFDDCRIPAANRLPKAIGLKSPLMCLSQARYGISFGAIGAAAACFEEALDYGKSRKQFDRPIAGFQLVQDTLVQMHTRISLAQMLSMRLATLKDSKLLKFPAISMAKRNNVEMALWVARHARDILGGNGIMEEYATMRHMCNLEAVVTYEGTHNIHTLILGEALTGLPAYYG